MLCDMVGGLLNKGIGGLLFLGVHHGDRADLFLASPAFLAPIRIKNDQRAAFFHRREIADRADQGISCIPDIRPGKAAESGHGKDHVIAVQHEIFLLWRLWLLGLSFFLGGSGVHALFADRARPDLSVSTLEDLHPFLLGHVLSLARCGGHESGIRISLCALALGFKMHHSLGLVPRHGVTASLLAEHGIRRMSFVKIGIVAAGGDHLFGVMAGRVRADRKRNFALALGVGTQGRRIRAQTNDGRVSDENGRAAIIRMARHRSAHRGNIVQRAANRRRRQLHRKIKGRLEYHALARANALAHGAVGRLAEVTALRVLQMRLAAHEGDTHVC